MKKIFVRTLCALFALLLVALAFAGCGKKKVDPGEEQKTGPVGSVGSNDSTETPVVTDEYGQTVVDGSKFDGLNFDRKTINILTRSAVHYRREFAMDNPETTFEQRVYERDIQVQKELNVLFNYVTDGVLHYTDENVSLFTTKINSAYLAGSEEEQVHIFGAASTLTSLMGIQGTLQDLGNTKYLDFDQPYWNQTFVNAARINNKLYQAVGDLNLSAFDRALVVFANNNMLVSNSIDENIYGTVLDGKWTMELMKEYIQAYGYTETDGIGGISDGDILGLACAYNSEFCDGWLAASGIHLLKMEDNELQVNTSAFMELDNVITKALAIRKAQGSLIVTNYFDKFIRGEALFIFDTLHSSNARLKRLHDMGNSSYAILPLPMPEEDPALNYGTVPQDQYSAYCIINYDQETSDMCSAVMELLCLKNYQKVRPYYVETILETRYSADSTSFMVMELIMDSLKFDTAIFYNLQLGALSFNMTRECILKERPVTTQWAAIKDTVTTKLADLNDRFFK